jgi:CMP-N,N'-diacetyllegionaminic acid synthase
MKKTIAIILCKGNSKGVKNKNIKKFSGKPLMYWTIQSLKESSIIKEIYISSDSDRILNYAKKQKIICIKRPKNLTHSRSQSEDSILHSIKHIKSDFDYIVFPQVTSPLRPKNIFDKSLRYFFKKKFDSLFSSNIPSKIFLWNENQKLKPKYNINKRPMRQDIKKIFLENGSFYIFKKNGFVKSKNRLFGKIGTYLVDKKYSYDIDEEIDFKINEIVKRKLENE